MKKASILLLLLFPLVSFAQANQAWITNASGVRARAMPATSGDEVARLPIGTVLRQLDSEQREGTVGGKKDFWYHLALPNSREGWVFGTFLTRFDEKRKGEIYRKIALEKVKAEDGSFAEFADLTRFLTAILPEVTDRTTLAELELARWLAVQKTFMKIPSDKMQSGEFQRFIKAYQANAAYSEPGGMWLVKAELLWSLQKKYTDLSIADTIAWEAANLPMPGECEDDDTCTTMYFTDTTARYLQVYPAGKYANKALDKLLEIFLGINEQMKHVETPKGNSQQDRQIRKDAIAAINKMRARIAKVSNPKKTKLLQLLTSYEKYYRKVG